MTKETTMQKLIHATVYAALTERPARRLDNYLWASDLGRNPYGAARRLLLGELEPFDYPILMKMDGGSALEDFTLRQVAENLERPIKTQFPLFNSIWSGYADLVIGHGSESVVIYDHKGSAGKWWDYKDSLPRAADCCQIWMYGQLYHETYGIMPRLGLYYRGWGSWGEFEIERLETEAGFHLQARGVITDEKGIIENEVIRIRDVDPTLLRGELEDIYHQLELNEISIDKLEAMAPDGPDWGYAEDATERLRR